MGWFQNNEEPIEPESPEQRLMLRLREEGIEVREHALQLRELAVKKQAEDVERRSKHLLERSQLLADPQRVEAAIATRLQKLEREEDRLHDSQRRLTQWEDSLEARLSEILSHEQAALRGITSPLAPQRPMASLNPSPALASDADNALPSLRLVKRALPVIPEVVKVTPPQADEMSLDPPVQGAYLKFQDAATEAPLADARGTRPRRRGKSTHESNSVPDLEGTGERIHHLNSDPIHLGLAREVATLRKGMLDLQQRMQSGSSPARNAAPVPMMPMSLPAEEADDAEAIPRARSQDRRPGSVVLW